MSDTETLPAVVPYSGEAVDISEPRTASRMLQESTAFYYELKSFQNACRDVLRAESDRLGARTFEAGPYKVEVASIEASVDTVYDVQMLWDNLLAAGLPVERLAEMIVYEPSVNGTIIRQLRKNPAYDQIIEAAVQSRNPKTRTVRVK